MALSSSTISCGASVLRHAAVEVDPHRLHGVWRRLRRHGHAELDEPEAVGRQLFERARLVAGVQAVLVGAVGLALRRLDRNVLRLAERDQLLAAGKPLAEGGDPPGGEHLDAWIERFGGELEAALVVALAGGPVGEHRAALAVRDLDAHLADQGPGDRRAQQIRALVAGLPLHRGEGEVAAQLLAHVHDQRLDGAAVAGLLEVRLAILAGLAQIDVHGHDLVALLDQPAEDHRGVQPARIRQHAPLAHLHPREKRTVESQHSDASAARMQAAPRNRRRFPPPSPHARQFVGRTRRHSSGGPVIGAGGGFPAPDSGATPERYENPLPSQSCSARRLLPPPSPSGRGSG
jgi:hypothetical protein